MRARIVPLAAPLLLGLLSACGAGLPLEEQDLREVLGADPEEIAALGPVAGRRLALRLEAARTAAAAEWRVAAPLDEGPEALVRAAGRDRKEPPLLSTLRPAGGELHVRLLPDPLDGPSAADLPPFSAPDGAAPSAAEARSLGGAGGRALRLLLRQAPAQRLVRVIGWPAGAAALGDAVHVNAAWLAALSFLEEEPLPAAAPLGEDAQVPIGTRVQAATGDSCVEDSCNRCYQSACDDVGDGPLGRACQDACHSQKPCAVASRGPAPRGAWQGALRQAAWLLLPLLVMLRRGRRRR